MYVEFELSLSISVFISLKSLPKCMCEQAAPLHKASCLSLLKPEEKKRRVGKQLPPCSELMHVSKHIQSLTLCFARGFQTVPCRHQSSCVDRQCPSCSPWERWRRTPAADVPRPLDCSVCPSSYTWSWIAVPSAELLLLLTSHRIVLS